MKVRYEHGGAHGPEEDPIKKILASQLAEERAGMMEGYTRVGEDIYETPFPSGAIQSDNPYLFDLMGLGALGKSALKYLAKKGSQTLGKGATRAAVKKASDPLADISEKQAVDRIQNVADRAIRTASKEESQAIVNLQGQLQKAVGQGLLEEAKAVKVFQEAVDNVFTQARIDYKILGGAERAAKDFGPSMRELYNTNRPLFDKVYNDLISPLTSKRIDGAVNPRMNEFGGVIKVVKK